ncbi:MAG: helix-turn-helix transcriptional regulator [Thermoguttaceae bacterium]
MLTEKLVIVEPRKLLGYAIRAFLIDEGTFSSIKVVQSSSEAISYAGKNANIFFLISGPSHLRVKQIVKEIRVVFPDSVLVIMEDQLRSGGALLFNDIQADGYWTFYDSPKKVVRGLIEAACRRESISPRALNRIKNTEHGIALSSKQESQALFKLSKREMELFMLLAQGKDLKICSLEMRIAEKSTRNLLDRLMKKLNVHSLVDLLWKTIDYGLVNTDNRYFSDDY